jgi:hypothetical protein
MSDTAPPPGGPQRVVVTNVEIPFVRLIAILIKFGLAAIPAAIIVWAIMAVIVALLGGFFAGGRGFMGGFRMYDL